MPIDRSYADQIIAYMFGHRQVIIDPTELYPLTTNTVPLILRSFEEARNNPLLKGLKWVYLHPQGDKFLQQYHHPEDNVVYCFGSDWAGLGIHPGDDEKADFLRVAAPDPDEEEEHKREFFAAPLIPMVAYDRAFKNWQKKYLKKV